MITDITYYLNIKVYQFLLSILDVPTLVVILSFVGCFFAQNAMNSNVSVTLENFPTEVSYIATIMCTKHDRISKTEPENYNITFKFYAIIYE